MRPCLTLCVIFVLLVSTRALADSPSVVDDLEAAKKKLANQTYLLRYKFTKGEVVRWRVVHLATTETRVKNSKQISQSRSVSTKKWRVTDVDDDGNFTFEHIVEAVDMRQRLTQWKKGDDDTWNQAGPASELAYNSQDGQKPPLVYEHVAETINVPLAAITVNPSGTVLKRDRHDRLSLGLGKITMPFPDQPLKVGSNWHALGQANARMPDKTIKQIKLRHRYTLADVKDNVARISVHTEVLTPVHDQRVKAQLVQQLVKGTVHFDIARGRLASQQMDWDETIVNFTGADSLMQYVARFSEELSAAPTEKVDEDTKDQPTTPRRETPRTAAKPTD